MQEVTVVRYFHCEITSTLPSPPPINMRFMIIQLIAYDTILPIPYRSRITETLLFLISLTSMFWLTILCLCYHVKDVKNLIDIKRGYPKRFMDLKSNINL